MPKQLPSPAEQLERLTDGLNRLLEFDHLAFYPQSESRRVILLADIEIERLEKECLNQK